METLDDKKIILKQYNKLLRYCKKRTTPENCEFLDKVFHFAWEAHKGARRKSGEPYILHPISVAQIVAFEMELGIKAIASSLLHDVVEDTDYTVDDIQNLFGAKVASIVDGLTKITGVFNRGSSIQAENFRRMLLTLSDDLRVILIKIADRLHNMRTLNSLPVHKQMKISGETLFLYSPLAHRIGLYAIKTELEDLSFKYEHPDEYQKIVEKIKLHEDKKSDIVNQIISPISQKLKTHKIKHTIDGHPKSIFSIWNQIQYENVSFKEVYDLITVRIIFKPNSNLPEKNQCWNIYSLITDIYKPKPERIRDWVSTPKANGYEALHMTVMGLYGHWVEIQIRTERMEEIARRGFVAHWRQNNGDTQESELDKWLKDVREVLKNPETDALAFLDEFKLNLFAREIQVFTPKGHIRTLPKNSTALDFAYDIHTEIGNHCIGAKVNHKLVPLSHVLKSGDQVEIVTSEKQYPKAEWNDFVVTGKAKSKIKDAFKAERREYIKKGTKIVKDKLKEIKLSLNAKILRKFLLHHHLDNKDDFYYNIGKGKLQLEKIENIIKKKSTNKFIRYWKLQLFGTGEAKETKTGIAKKPVIDKKKILKLSDSITDENYIIARCCNPIPGDKLFGYTNTSDTVTIHKRKCPNAIKLMSSQGDRILAAEWITHRLMSFLAVIKLKGIDKVGLVNEVTNIISRDHDVNMRALNFESHDGIFEGIIHLYVHDTEDLNNLIVKLMKIKGIESVKRVEDIEQYGTTEN